MVVLDRCMSLSVGFGFLATGYFIAVDRERKQIVLTIRGTQSFKDVVTDVAAVTTPFFTGHCHNGMTWAARWFFLNLKPLLLHLLRHHPSHGLTIVGHSLGAGPLFV